MEPVQRGSFKFATPASKHEWKWLNCPR